MTNLFLNFYQEIQILAQARIDKLIFVESDADVPLIIENFSFISDDHNTKFTGTVDSGSLDGAFVTSGDNVAFKLNVNSQTYDINIEENYKKNILESGKFSMETSGLAHKVVKLIPDLAVFSNTIKNSKEKVKITLDIKPSNNHIFLKNIVIISDSIFGTGEMSLSKNNLDNNDIKLEFTKMDVDSWRKSKSEDPSAYITKYSSNKRFDFSKNPMQMDISIKDIKLDENNSLSDISIKTAIKDAKWYIQDISGKIDQSGKFKINGVITQNSFRSLFNGKVEFNHKDLNDFAEYFAGPELRSGSAIPFALNTDVKMSSVDLSLQNLLIKTNDTDIVGNLSTKFIGNFPRTNATIRFSIIDIDKSSFPVLSQTFDYAMSLFDGMKDEDYLNKFIPIRKINYIADYDITFDHLLVGKRKYENVNFNLETSPGKVSLEQLFIQNGKDWIDTSVSLQAEGIKPVIYFTIHNAFMGVDFLSAPSMLRLRKKILDNMDLSKVDVAMNLSIKKLYQDSFSLDRVLFQARNNKNLLDIKKFDADLFGGRMQSSGSILLDPYTLNFVYALNSARIDEIAKLLPQGILESGGYLSASGMWSTRGDKLNEQLYNLYTRSNVVTKNIELHNFSIDDLIQKMGIVNYNALSLKDDTKKALLTGKTQISDLKTKVDLSKGIFTLSDLLFKTKYSSATGSVLFNLYDFNIDASTIFSFYLAQPRYGRSTRDYAPTKMTVTAKGNFLSPKKNANTKELEEALKVRNKQ